MTGLQRITEKIKAEKMYVTLKLEMFTVSVRNTGCKRKYTWAPQTVHNTPVMNILKGYFYIRLF